MSLGGGIDGSAFEAAPPPNLPGAPADTILSLAACVISATVPVREESQVIT
ncbi:unnamed protein product [Spirodela intermedia]|uniref:Uncharacterized protein n=1 Tax=Spirodela intermedia TaxID=51605 RepID=A0A7I8KRB9_SPIIN|nr:unnamed protein product [Spirodela intermedia]